MYFEMDPILMHDWLGEHDEHNLHNLKYFEHDEL